MFWGKRKPLERFFLFFGEEAHGFRESQKETDGDERGGKEIKKKKGE